MKWKRDRENHVELLCSQCDKPVGLGIDEHGWSNSFIEWSLEQGWKESNGEINDIRCQSCRENSKDRYVYAVIGVSSPLLPSRGMTVWGIYNTMAEARRHVEGSVIKGSMVVRWGRTSV